MANWLARAQASLADHPAEDAPRRQQPQSRAEAANDEAARHWHVRYPGLDPMEVIFTPEATRAEVATLYPGARIDALTDPQRPTAAPDEAAEPAECADDRRPGRERWPALLADARA